MVYVTETSERILNTRINEVLILIQSYHYCIIIIIIIIIIFLYTKYCSKKK